MCPPDVSHPPRVLLLVFAATAYGCGSPFSIQYETEHLRIGTNLDHPLCQGDLASYERVIAYTESDLGFELQETVDVYVWRDSDAQDVRREGCKDEPVFGCFDSRMSTIWTTTFALEHELVHAVVRNPDLEQFFQEGIANVYAGQQTRFGWSAPSANAHASAFSADRLTAAHFVRWLMERWGGYKLGQLAMQKGSAFENFEAVYGMPLVAAEELYLSQAPAGYASLYPCDAPELGESPYIQGWRAKIEFDCGSEDTFGGFRGLVSHRTLVVEEAELYSISTDGDWFNIYLCSEGAIDYIPPEQELAEFDVPPDYAGFPDGTSRYFEGGEVHDVYLERGRYDIGLGIDGYEAGDATIAAWPSLAPRPAKPGEVP